MPGILAKHAVRHNTEIGIKDIAAESEAPPPNHELVDCAATLRAAKLQTPNNINIRRLGRPGGGGMQKKQKEAPRRTYISLLSTTTAPPWRPAPPPPPPRRPPLLARARVAAARPAPGPARRPGPGRRPARSEDAVLLARSHSACLPGGAAGGPRAPPGARRVPGVLAREVGSGASALLRVGLRACLLWLEHTLEQFNVSRHHIWRIEQLPCHGRHPARDRALAAAQR